jgi:hypothetical protein
MDAAAFTDFFLSNGKSPAHAGLLFSCSNDPWRCVTSSNDDDASSGGASDGGGDASPNTCGASGDGANPSAGGASPSDGDPNRDDGRGPSELPRA